MVILDTHIFDAETGEVLSNDDRGVVPDHLCDDFADSGVPLTFNAACILNMSKALDTLAPEELKRSSYFRQNLIKVIQRMNNPEVREVVKKYQTTLGTLKEYLCALANCTNWHADKPIYCRREHLAKQIGCSIATVGRCRQAAIELGFHTKTFQTHWMPQDGVWVSGPSVLYLTKPTCDTRSVRMVEKDVQKAQYAQLHPDMKQKNQILVDIEHKKDIAANFRKDLDSAQRFLLNKKTRHMLVQDPDSPIVHPDAVISISESSETIPSPGEKEKIISEIRALRISLKNPPLKNSDDRIDSS